MEIPFEVFPLPLSAYSPTRPRRRALISYPIRASLESIPSALTPPPPEEFDGRQPDPSKSTGLSGLTLFGIIVGALLVVVLFSVCAWFCSYLQRQCGELEDEPVPVPIRPAGNQNGYPSASSHQQQQQSNRIPLMSNPTVDSHQQQQRSNEIPRISENVVASQQNQQVNEIPPTSNISTDSQQHEQQNEITSTNVYYSTVSQQHGQQSEIASTNDPSTSSLQHQQQNERPSSNEAPVGSQQQQQEQQNGISSTISPDDPSVSSQQQNEIPLTVSPKIFTYQELEEATNGFSQDNHIGTGGFGLVYKGVLEDGIKVAIKRLTAGSQQGENEFQAEVDIISNIRHKNLVHLIGYCTSGTERLLVYELIPNESLYSHLHGKDKPVLEWSKRFDIALGTAEGLGYLHEGSGKRKIIHRDIKSLNILLDERFEAKVADFGLAKFFPDDYTHISTAVKGTFGYMDPDYAFTRNLTEKSDVYSYGILLLELITGCRPLKKLHPTDEDNLAIQAKPLLTKALKDGKFGFVDKKLLKQYNNNEMSRMVACAAACVCHKAKRRPKMSQIYQALIDGKNLNDLTKGITTEYNFIEDREHMQTFLNFLEGIKRNGIGEPQIA